MTDYFVSAGQYSVTIGGVTYYLAAGQYAITISGITYYVSAGQYKITAGGLVLLADEQWNYSGSPPSPKGWETWDIITNAILIVTEDWGSVTLPNIQVTSKKLDNTLWPGGNFTLKDRNGSTVQSVTSNNAYSYCFPAAFNNYTLLAPGSISSKAFQHWDDGTNTNPRTISLADNSLTQITAYYAN